jgi:hypothetical protein
LLTVLKTKYYNQLKSLKIVFLHSITIGRTKITNKVLICGQKI